MTEWLDISSAPIGEWVLVKWDAPVSEPQGGPWDYGMIGRFPPPPCMVAAQIPGDRYEWRAYSEDGGIYGDIPAPSKWMRLPT